MEYFCGIDIGASTAKLVIADAEGRIVGKALQRSGVDYTQTARILLDEAVQAASIDSSQIVRSLSTGYGRDNVPWSDGKMTEIACHGRGAYFHFEQRMTVVDIGAQDSKVIHIDDRGRRISFKMNRKCAAGTGAFIEEIAHRLALDVSELNALAERSTNNEPLGSFCTVFAATEVLTKIRDGVDVADIVRGAFCSVVNRIVEMTRIEGILVATGGVVAHNPFLATLMGRALGTEAQMPPDPQFMGAFGAALFATQQSRKGQE
ncbi:MAG: acyl-CoA dehydratase activase [Phycisphaerae bacterium]|jgi:predicted CoA-substrate-specific enzyme activase|nr:acyl-CoA dehydratase activase [Phycisphaerae bacterium]